MKQYLTATLAALCLMAPIGLQRPATAAETILDAVPAEAWGMLCVPNLASTDQKLLQMAQIMNAPAMSPLQGAKMYLGIISGVDDNGSLAVVFMPVDNFEMGDQGLAILIPTTSYNEFVSMFDPQDAGDGVSKIMLADEESYVAQKGTYAVVAPYAETVKKVIKSSKGINSVMTAHTKKRLATDDITVWGNLGAIFSSPAFQAVKTEAESEPGAKQGFEMLAKFDVGSLSLAVSPEGFRLGGYFKAKEGSDLAKAMASIEPPSNGVLAGLPADNNVFAYGQAHSKNAADLAATFIDEMIGGIPADQLPISPEAKTAIRPHLASLIKNHRNVAVSLSNLPEGPDGVLAISAVIGVDGGTETYLNTVDQLIATIKQSFPPEQAEMVNNAVTYQDNAEGSTDIVKLDAAMLGASPDDVAEMQKIFGQDGIAFRLAPAGSDSVALTLGGGAGWLEKVVGLASAKRTPLYESAAIKAASQAKPEKCIAEGYLSLSGVQSLMSGIEKAVDEPAPFMIPEVATPLSLFTEATGEGGQQSDVYIPIDVVKAISQMVTGMMMGGGGQPPM